MLFKLPLVTRCYSSSCTRAEHKHRKSRVVGNFPGFEHGCNGQTYRLYIEYYNANGDQLNTGIELSEFATPLFQASAPRDLTDLCACGCRNCHWRRSLVCTVGDWVRNRVSNVLLVALCLCSDFLYRSKNQVSYWPFFPKLDPT